MAYPVMLTLAFATSIICALPRMATPLNPSLAFYNDQRGYSTRPGWRVPFRNTGALGIRHVL